MQEIERKFAVASLPDDLGEGTHLAQGYVAVDDHAEVRVRDAAGTTTLTIKAGKGLQRTEVEVLLSGEQAAALLEIAALRTIDKVRYRCPVGTHVAEVDVYAGHLDGLVTVEVEFASIDEAAQFTPPDWFGDELTGDERWSNASLALRGHPRT